ncbi:uncharacterized protein PV07_09440 [Cladophialophora immunda]|uniref:Uncharacterized protein n=1 Tax=Cladophialophora immunda TaxID=569365 RepID=A0A0D2C757_9EURO|nr:uncharacterized protein PV07_09440 [Cladophialophora immunda]KIW26340.1 hypothetical protein PV07_09440 [Cladophialophora immunda]
MKERDEKVKLMQYVFYRAVNVQAWLGHSSQTIEPLIDTINDDTALQSLFIKTKSDPHLDICVHE